MARNSRLIVQPFHSPSTAGAGMAGDSFVAQGQDYQVQILEFGITSQTSLCILTIIFIEGVDYPFAPHRWINQDIAYEQAWELHDRTRAIAAGIIGTLGGLEGAPALIRTALGNPEPFIDYYPYPHAAVLARRRLLEWSASYLSLALQAPSPPIIPANTYNVPVCELLDEIQRHVLEVPDLGLTIGSGLWTVTEVLNYLNLRTYRFLLETGILQVRTLIPAPAGISEVDLPTDLIDIKRVAWTRGATTSELPREELFQVDAWIPTWETVGSADPTVYAQAPEISLQLQLVPVPSNAGTVDLTYVARTPAVTNDCNIYPLPDEWAPFVKYGVLADMWAKEGEANDPERSSYCEQRYKEGVSLARLLLGVES